jgi:hypothetical protein
MGDKYEMYQRRLVIFITGRVEKLNRCTGDSKWAKDMSVPEDRF